MKKTTFSLWSGIILLQIIIFSCGKEDTTTPDPTDIRANFLGTWSVNEKWTKLTYEVAITSESGSSDGVYIENFAGSGAGVKTHASVSGNAITIAPLPQTLSNGWIIETGSGSLQGTTKINWNYVFNDQANTYTATATYTKK
jgi:hypothetical protein